jgi:hypothetical protein
MQQIINGTVTTPQGFRATAVAAHIKYPDRLDLALIVSERDCSATAVFTTNQVVAAPVIVDRETLQANDTTCAPCSSIPVAPMPAPVSPGWKTPALPNNLWPGRLAARRRSVGYVHRRHRRAVANGAAGGRYCGGGERD